MNRVPIRVNKQATHTHVLRREPLRDSMVLQRRSLSGQLLSITTQTRAISDPNHANWRNGTRVQKRTKTNRANWVDVDGADEGCHEKTFSAKDFEVPKGEPNLYSLAIIFESHVHTLYLLQPHPQSSPFILSDTNTCTHTHTHHVMHKHTTCLHLPKNGRRSPEALSRCLSKRLRLLLLSLSFLFEPAVPRPLHRVSPTLHVWSEIHCVTQLHPCTFFLAHMSPSTDHPLAILCHTPEMSLSPQLSACGCVTASMHVSFSLPGRFLSSLLAVLHPSLACPLLCNLHTINIALWISVSVPVQFSVWNRVRVCMSSLIVNYRKSMLNDWWINDASWVNTAHLAL